MPLVQILLWSMKTMWCTGLRDLVRVITRPDKAPQDDEEEIIGGDDDDDEEEEEDDEEDEEDEAVSEESESDLEMAGDAAADGIIDEAAERPAGMEVDNGVPSTSDHVRML